MKAWWVHAYTKCVAALCSRRSSPWPFGVVSWGATRWPSSSGVDKVLQRSGALHGARRLAQLFTDDTTARCVHAGAKKQAFSAVAETVRLYRAFIWWPGHNGKLPILFLHPRIQLYHPQDDPSRHVVFSFCRLAVLSSISARALSCSCYVCALLFQFNGRDLRNSWKPKKGEGVRYDTMPGTRVPDASDCHP